MNKIILIILVTSFAICSKSWAESMIDGKGLVCKSKKNNAVNELIFHFIDGFVYEYILYNNLEVGKHYRYKKIYYSIYKNEYKWTISLGGKWYDIYSLNRKNLELTNIVIVNSNKIGEDKYNCKIYNSLDSLKRDYFEPIIKERQGKQDKDNKI